MDTLVQAHEHSINNQEEVLQSQICGCYYCLSIFPPENIDEWLKEYMGKMTAFCPVCKIDAVIGSFSGYPITKEFLKSMQKHWFDIELDLSNSK